MSDKIRTLLHVFSTFNVGGPQIRFAQIANHFGRKYRHRIVALDGGTDAFQRLSSDLDVALITIPYRRGALWANIATFRNEIRKLQPDLLITSNWGAIEWAMANIGSRTRHLHMEDGFGRDEADRQVARRVWVRRFALHKSTVVLPSKVLLSIARDVWRLPPARLLYIPNGVNCERFRVACDPQFLARFGVTGGLPVIGTVAALRSEKNLYRLIDAFAGVLQRRRAQLVIVGDGPERSRLHAHALALGIGDQVFFTGAQAEPEKFLACFNVFALTSDTEQMPLSVLEAMATSLPLVATDVGDIRHMIAEENAPFLVKPNIEALAEAILTLVNDPALATALGLANAQRVAKLFSEHRMFTAYGNLFDGSAASPRHSSNHAAINHNTAT